MKRIIIFVQMILFMLLFSYPVHAETALKDVVYTSFSGKGSAETGTADAPYSKFEDAVANVADGGTIYVIGGDVSEHGYINVQSNQNAPFIIDKNVTIEPANGAAVATISCRAAGILLEADVTFKNIEMDFVNAYHDHIYANGYHLTLDNVTRYQGAKLIDLVAGGLYDATTGMAVSVNEGNAATITIKGKNSSFGNVYAGGINGGYSGDVTIEMQNVSTTSVNEIYACGATEPYVNTDNFFDFGEPDYPTANPTQYPVTGNVKIAMEDAGILYVNGEGATDGTEVSYATTYLRAGQALHNISKLTVEKGTVQPKELTAPEGQNVDVQIQTTGVLDISNYTSFHIDHFVGGGKLIVAQDSLLTIHESATGNTVFETANCVMRWGDYIKMPIDATAIFDYTPIYDQKGWTLECSQDDTGKIWSAVMVDTIYISYWTESAKGEVSIDYEILLPDEMAEGATAIPNEGYHFVKWVNYDTEEVVSTEATFIPTWGEDYELQYYYDAYFALNTYGVRFDANGGMGIMPEQPFTYSVEQELNSCEFVREGYEFIGWNTKVDGTGIKYSDKEMVKNMTAQQDGVVVLYAQWKNLNAGSGTEGEGTESGGTEGEGTENGGTESGGTESGGTESGGTESGGTESGGTESGGTENGGTESGGTESGGTESGGTESGGTESGGTENGGIENGGTENEGNEDGNETQDGSGETGDEGTGDDSSGAGDFQPNTEFDLSKVKGAKVSKVTYNTVTLSWNVQTGATGYEIYRSTKKNSGYKKVATVTRTTYKDTKLKTGKKYYYKVRAVSEDKQSAFSGILTGKPALAKPAAKVVKGKKSATITYGKVTGAQGYEIYRSTKKKKGFKKVVTTKKVKYKNRKLKSKKTYYYKVRAYRKVDGKKVYSSFSNVKAVKVK